MIIPTFSIVVSLKLYSVADQVHYFYCQQWAHLEEIQFHVKDKTFLVLLSIPVLFCTHTPLNQPHTTIYHRLTNCSSLVSQLPLYPLSQAPYVSFIMGSLFSLSTPQNLSGPCLWWFSCRKCSSFLLNLSSSFPFLWSGSWLSIYAFPVLTQSLLPSSPTVPSRVFILFGSDSSTDQTEQEEKLFIWYSFFDWWFVFYKKSLSNDSVI